MITMKAHRIKLNPTPEQEKYFWQAAGVSRFAWNWALGEYNRRKDAEQGVKIIGKGATLKSEFTALKQTDFPWLGDVTSYAYQQAFQDLQKAFSRFYKFKKEGKLKPPKGFKPRGDGKPYGWPRFKSRNRSTPSFYQANNSLKTDGHNVYIQKCPGLWVNMAETLRFDGKIMGGRISYRHGQWWISIQVEVEVDAPEPKEGAVGVDLGIKYLAVIDDGQDFVEIKNPRAFRRAMRKLRRLQRKLDRQRRANNPDNYNENGTVKRGGEWVSSKGMTETESRIRKLHYRIACIRNDASHKMTTELAKNYGIVGVEDLNIKGMMKNRRLAKDIAAAAFYEKRRQLEYKVGWNGGVVVPVDQWFPSSKTCNECGWVNVELKLSDRQWTCLECGVVHHRDQNAARNIRAEALRILE